LLPRFGITRVGDLTGLDRIGIPVAIAVRPNARALAVAQGKGATPVLARVSAIMEAADSWHAEDIAARFRRASYAALAACHAVADPAMLARTARPFDPDVPIDWIAATDLLGGGEYWVPAECVSTDYRLPRGPRYGYFAATTNGLAGGAHLLEAVIAGICEIIERDAVTLMLTSADTGHHRRLDPDSVDDGACRDLLGRCVAAGMVVRLWNATSDLGVAAFRCELTDPTDPALRVFAGAACHLSRAAALAGAIAEAAQSRLTIIGGMRDDTEPDDYVTEGPIAMAGFLASLAPPGRAGFHDAPDLASADLGADLRCQLARLRHAGVTHVAAVDLTDPDIGVPVVKIVIPGLEGRFGHPDYTPGPRASRRTT
jgi:YcaO-like protein with predicted kinase domain